MSNKKRNKIDSDSDYLISSNVESSSDSAISDNESNESIQNISVKGNQSYECDYKKPSAKEFYEKQFVPDSHQGGKYYAKANCCPYCLQRFKRIGKHLISMHSEKRTVIKIMSYPPKHPKRVKLFDILRNSGNERFNKDPILNPTGEQIVKRRLAINKGKNKKIDNSLETEASSDAIPKTTKEFNQHLGEKAGMLYDHSENDKSDIDCKDTSKSIVNRPLRVLCTVCRGYFSRNNYNKHLQLNHATEKSIPTKNAIAASRREMQNYHELASNRMRKDVLPYLQEDEIGMICRFDKTIILYGNKFSERHSHVDQAQLVRGHMRLLGRLTMELKTLNPSIKELQTCFRGIYWSVVLQAIKIISGYNEQTNELKTPYNGRTLGMLIKRLIIILRAKFEEEEDDQRLKWLTTFFSLYDNEFSVTIASKATLTENKARRNTNADILPTSNDIKTFIEYLKTKRKISYDYLEDSGYHFNHWLNLLECTMTIIQLFNRRRNIETERAEIENFDNRRTVNEKDEYFKTLTSDDKKQSIKYERFETQGKKIDGIDGSIYINKSDIKSLETIIKYRHEAGVPKQNNFLFGLPNPTDNRLKHANAYIVMTKLTKECASQCNIERESALRATKLRKQLATKFSVMGQDENLDNLAQNMSHTTKTHSNYYRKIVNKVDVDVTRVLEKVNGEYSENETDVDTSVNQSTENEVNSPQVEIKCKKQNTKVKSTTDKVKIVRCKWTERELHAFETAFALQLKGRKYPNSREIREAIERFPCLQSRGEESIRTRFSNLMNKPSPKLKKKIT